MIVIYVLVMDNNQSQRFSVVLYYCRTDRCHMMFNRRTPVRIKNKLRVHTYRTINYKQKQRMIYFECFQCCV